MPVFRYVPQDPTDTVLQGEQLRSQGIDARPSGVGNVIFAPVASVDVLDANSAMMADADSYPPMNSFAEVGVMSARRRKGNEYLPRANAGIATPCGEWVQIDYQPLVLYKPGGYERLTLTGVSRDSAGAALGGCTVKIFSSINDVKLYETVSDGSGDWSVDVAPNPGPFYYVEYKVGSPDVAGTSLNTNVPTKTN
jgi:hypothetical protein